MIQRAMSEEQTDSLVQTIFYCSKEIDMEFKISKCVVYTIKRKAPITSQQLNLFNDEKISDHKQRSFKYISILELDDFMNQYIKKTATNTYFKRLRLLLKSKSNERNLINTINT